jgi:hypothetical protein
VYINTLHCIRVGWFLVFNATFNNISVISWRSVLLVEETRVPGENHRPVASHWQTVHCFKYTCIGWTLQGSGSFLLMWLYGRRLPLSMVCELVWPLMFLQPDAIKFYICRITAALKVVTEMITSILASPRRRAAIVMVMYVKTYKTDIIVFICNAIICLTSSWSIISRIRVSLFI